MTRSEIELLIEGKTIEKPVHEDITYDDVYDSFDNLWNFMFFTGYLKKVNERMDSDDNRFIELSIPNKEVKYIFKNKILKWFDEKIKAEDLSSLYKSIIDGDKDYFQKELNRLLRSTISFNDAYENFYHGFIAGILSNMKGYIVKSNRETGDGRCEACSCLARDALSNAAHICRQTNMFPIFIKPLSIFDRCVIIELKVCNKPKELFTYCDTALNQIDEKKYESELNEEGYEDIIKYGIAFYRKDCLIKMNK